MVENALYIRINENTKEVLQCLNSAIDEILETDILYIQNAAPCYKIQVLDSQGYPLYIYEDSQLIPVTEDQRFKFHIKKHIENKIKELREFTQAYIYNHFWQERQINSQNDFTYNLSVLSAESGKSKQEIEIAIDTWINGSDLVQLLNDIDSISLDTLYTAIGIKKSKKYEN